MSAMASADDAVREKATKDFAGQLQLRASAPRLPELIEPLTRLFRASSDPHVRTVCVQMLIQIAPDGPTPVAILEAFSDPHPWVVQSALYAQHYFAIDPAFDAICRFVMTADNPMIRDSAVRALGELGDARAIPVVLHVLADRSMKIDQWFGSAAIALSRLGPAAVLHLIELSKDADARLRHAAAIGLDLADGPAADIRLAEIADDPDERVRTRVGQALQRRSQQ
jgi:hypothetical protein